MGCVSAGSGTYEMSTSFLDGTLLPLTCHPAAFMAATGSLPVLIPTLPQTRAVGRGVATELTERQQ